MNAARLLEYFDRIAEAPDAVSRLRKFILDLAVRGELVEQDPNDEPASDFLKKYRQKSQSTGRGRHDFDPVGEEEKPYELPSSWQWVRIGEVFEYDAGKKLMPSGLVSESWLLELEDIEKDTSRLLAKVLVKERDVLSTKSEFLVGDILYGKLRPYLNKVLVAKEPGYSSTEIVAIRPRLKIFPEYCCLAFRRPDFVSYVERLGQGTKMPRLRTSDAVMGLFPLPPLAEQHRIVAKVDELMALCDRLEASQAKRESRRDRLASASLKRIGQPEDVGNGLEFRENVRFHLRHLPCLATRPEHVKELRQTILNLAVRGKLVPQDSNDEPASELLNIVSVERKRLLRTKKVRNIRYDDVIREDDQPFPLPVGWSWVRFGDLILDSDSGWSPQTESFPRSGDAWGVLKVSAVSWDEFKPEQNKQLLSGVVPPDSAKVNEGDFLISRANTSELVAKCVIVSSCPDNLIMSDKIVRLYFARECNKYYLKVVNNYADYARIFYSEKSSGTSLSMQNVTRQQIYSLPIPLPPLAEQHRIVAKVDELMNLCDQLEAHLATNQMNQSKLLEATLCDALGVTCLPVSRPSRPAPSPTRIAARPSEQPLRPIPARPVEAPKPMVQGSLIEQSTPKVKTPRTVVSDIPRAVLAQMQPGQEYSRAQLAEALGLSVSQWNMAIRELKESGRVVQSGEKRGARYRIN